MPDGGRALSSHTPKQTMPAHDEEEISRVYGKYLLVRKLAEGGMAEIFLAKHMGAEGFERNVVIKRILRSLSSKPEFVEMFLQEAKLAAQLSHPNIVQIHDLGFAEGCHYICMEYLAGEDLSAVLSAHRKARRQIPLAVALKVIADAARGLHYAHEMRDDEGNPLQIVHRDVSPANIHVSYQGQVKVLDFGVAKARSQVTRTGVGTVKGKFQYMAPEQALGEDVDRRADVYSLGVILYEAVTLTRPYGRLVEAATLKAVLDGKFTPVRELRPDLPAELEEIVHRAMASTPAARFQTADELATAIDQHMQGSMSTFSPRVVANFMHSVAGEERILRRTRFRPSGLVSQQPALGGGESPLARSGDTGSPSLEAQVKGSGAGWVRALLRPGLLAAILSLVLIAGLAAWTVARPRLEARHALEAVRLRITSGQLLSPADDSAVALIGAARARFPDHPDLPALSLDLVTALRKEGKRALDAGQTESAIQSLEACLQLAPGDAAASATLEAARRTAFATGAGMVRVGELWIDRYEYPNVQGVAPMTKVDWDQAEANCRGAGKRLCTEVEWELACVGPEGRRAFPYGDVYEEGRCHEGQRETGPALAGSKEGCVTEDGVADLSGNVAEWTSSPVVPGSPQRVVRGGAWHPGAQLSCKARDYFLPGQGGARDIGFRCCY